MPPGSGELAAQPADEAAKKPRVLCEHAERCGGCPLIGLTYGLPLTAALPFLLHRDD